MLHVQWRSPHSTLFIGLALAAAVAPAGARSHSAPQGWRTSFPVDKADLVDHGRNSYYVLEPGYRLHFEGEDVKLVVSVLDETKVVDGVRTRIVEERETKGGDLVEVSRNYMAMNKTTGDVYYFGEAVDIYKNGKVTSHEGAWQAGINGARFGLMVPGKPTVGTRYYQEIAPRVAMDRAVVISVAETLRTPAGTFKNCMRTRESSALESGSEEKLYVRGVGLVKDDKLVLVRVEKPEAVTR
jgi:hypothetical protein